MKYIVGNWKMNQDLAQVEDFINSVEEAGGFDCQSWIAPQSVHISPMVSKTKSLKIGAQNTSRYLSGAYTGELSPAAIKNIGASFTIIGHSERRAYFNEDNKELNQKIQAAFKAKLDVIYCVGETLEQREQDQTFGIIKKQIFEGLNEIIIPEGAQLIVAYEPVWAIGTGKSATPEQAQEVHQQIRHYLKEIFSQEVPLLYGGSVKPNNIESLLLQDDIDGALVGGASLKAQDFIVLCQVASKTH